MNTNPNNENNELTTNHLQISKEFRKPCEQQKIYTEQSIYVRMLPNKLTR